MRETPLGGGVSGVLRGAGARVGVGAAVATGGSGGGSISATVGRPVATGTVSKSDTCDRRCCS
ncbi:UNVERIFIED_ORG: hypothetical protein ABIC72_006619, partial [Burkholderia sp. 1988]|nr:hypothetical protein [Paraburkholderia terricola]